MVTLGRVGKTTQRGPSRNAEARGARVILFALGAALAPRAIFARVPYSCCRRPCFRNRTELDPIGTAALLPCRSLRPAQEWLRMARGVLLRRFWRCSWP